jgi:hypothetical protein
MGVMVQRLFLIIFGVSIYLSVYSQEVPEKSISQVSIIDSLKRNGIIFNGGHTKPEIILTTDQAVKLLQHKTQPQFWKDIHDPFRQTLSQLVFEASHPKFDSVASFLKTYPFDSIDVPWDKFYIWEPLRIKIPYISASTYKTSSDTTLSADTNLVITVEDSTHIKILDGGNPLLFSPDSGLKDTTIMVIIDTLNNVPPTVSSSPFAYYTSPYQSDSIQVAVSSLLRYLEVRDSIIVRFKGVGDEVIPVWMNSKKEKIVRFWLKNEFSDSVTVWIGNPSRNTVGLYLEKGINFRRPVKQGNYSEAKINIQAIDNSKLLNIQNIKIKIQNWKYRTEASFVLNQTALSNWVRGGDKSISTTLDITGYADYINKKMLMSSNNFARLLYGYIATGEDGIRKNLDLLETNSKLNHKAFGKFDFSAILLFKTQLAVGKKYFLTSQGDDSAAVVSKFMNPAVLTIGFGLDYKPNATTSLNFSPLTYKGTFVPDTGRIAGRIDQTQYGIARNRKSLNEPGVSFMITNEFKPLNTVTITSRLQFFTNYIHNPQNVDIDWEMIAVANLNWFTDVRLNTHFIFDDDTRTPELDKKGRPVLRSDGTEKKTARVQFKEMLGLSLVFRF